jgi:hypothetical protein
LRHFLERYSLHDEPVGEMELPNRERADMDREGEQIMTDETIGIIGSRVAARTTSSFLLSGLLLSFAIGSLSCQAANPSVQIANKTLVGQLARGASSAKGQPELTIHDLPAKRTVSLTKLFTIRFQDGSVLERRGYSGLRREAGMCEHA